MSTLKLATFRLPPTPGTSGRGAGPADEAQTGKYKYRIKAKTDMASTSLVMFHCRQTDAIGVFNPRDMSYLTKVALLDAQTEAMQPITRFLSENGSIPAVQLAHAGRKAGVPGAVAPSALAWSSASTAPAEATPDDIRAVVRAFADAARRAVEAGFQALEIHAAHGFLLHEFLSPIANHRVDEYGGDFSGRTRLTLEVVRAVRRVWPDRLPLFVRISATDWIPGGWDLEQSVALSRLLSADGVDLVDCSSGGISPEQRIDAGPGYQVAFAERVRREAGVMTAAVGLITEPGQADAIVRQGRADAVLIGRESLRDPYWPLRAARDLGHDQAAPEPYRRAW
mgnify:CR=1 FL=1